MSMSWDIIFWRGSNAVSYVPSSWANDNKTKYKWPLTEKGSSSKITKCEELVEDYTWFPADHKKTVYTLKEAKHYSKKGEEISSLESDDMLSSAVLEPDSRHHKKLKRIEPVLSDTDSETDIERDSQYIRPKVDVGKKYITISIFSKLYINIYFYLKLLLQTHHTFPDLQL